MSVFVCFAPGKSALARSGSGSAGATVHKLRVTPNLTGIERQDILGAGASPLEKRQSFLEAAQ